MKNKLNNINFFKHLAKCLYISFFVINLTFVFLIPSVSHANHQSVLFISQQNKSFSSSLIDSIKNKLKKNYANIDIKQQSDNVTLSEDYINSYDLIVTLGSKPAEKILQHTSKKPVLSLLITNRAFYSLNKLKNKNQPWSILLLNQPIERQLLLIKHMLGENKIVGTILGPYSSKHKKELISAFKKSHLKLEYETTQITDQLISSLKNLTRKSDVLLAIPDPVAFNKKTIRGILLLTYRKKIPVIGFSKSYVKAGAAAAIYSSPEQISRHAAELITNFFNNNLKFKENIYQPKYFSISINNKVIRTLDIEAKDRKKIEKLIKLDENIK